MRHLLLAVALAAGCGDDGGGTDAGSDSGVPADGGNDAGSDAGTDAGPAGLVWMPCRGAFECATLQVPLDHDEPAGDTIEISLLRQVATRPGERIGVLLFNPGGPGGSGIEAGAQAFPVISLIAPALAQRFDLIAFDPRGIGESTPVDCLDDAELEALRATLDFDPPDDPGWMALDATMRTFAEACAAESPPGLLDHVSTEDVARDMDLIRAGLDEEEINYIGISYGTYLGATYATLFPDRVRSFVFDSVVTPLHTDQVDRLTDGAIQYEAELDRFLADCGTTATCPFHGGEGAGAAGAALDALAATAEGAGLPAGARTLHGFDLRAGVSGFLRNVDHSALAAALAAAEDGDATILLEQADGFIGRRMDGSYTNFLGALLAVSYLDFPCPDGFDLAAARAASAAAVSAAGPRLAPFTIGATFACLHWPVPPQGPPFEVSAAGAPPILLINSRIDPATPVENVAMMQGALGNGSHVIIYEGGGHGTITRSTCARDQGVAFLLDPTTPPAMTSCPAE